MARKIGTVVNNIYMVTPDKYNHFKFIQHNRTLNKSHIMKLQKSMEKRAYEIPILVNDNYGIIDGQHSFSSRMNLNLPVFYMMIPGLTDSDAVELNILMEKWNEWNYARHFAGKGNEHYKRYLLFRSEFKYSHKGCLNLLSNHSADSGLIGRMFKEGIFTVEDYNQAREQARMIRRCREIYVGWKSSRFVNVMLLLFKNTDYDHERFLVKLNQKPYELIRDLRLAGNTKSYLRAIEDIYNFNVKKGQKYVRLDLV